MSFDGFIAGVIMFRDDSRRFRLAEQIDEVSRSSVGSFVRFLSENKYFFQKLFIKSTCNGLFLKTFFVAAVPAMV